MNKLEQQVNTINTKVNDLTETLNFVVNFLQHKAFVKEDLAGFARKEDLAGFVRNEDFINLKNDVDHRFSILQTTMDNFIKKIDDYHLEFLSLGQKVDRHEDWIEKPSPKVGVKLK